MLPDAEEGAIDALEAMIGKMEPLTTIISRVAESSAGMTEAGMVQKLLEEIFADMPDEYMPQILEEREIRWNCDCSHERMSESTGDDRPS